MTYLQAVNKVLKRLRQDQVAAVDENDYSALIGELVNQAKDEVEESWQWSAGRTTISINTSNGVSQYALTGMGENGRVLLDENKNPRIWNDTDDVPMRMASNEYIYRLLNSSGVQNGTPICVAFEGEDGSGDPYVQLWPIPDGVYNIDFHVYIPQAELSDGADVIRVPSRPVILGAYALAVWERGEDRGSAWDSADRKYHDALADAISYDALLVPEETIARVV